MPVNKCITICTPSIYGYINGSPCPPTYLVSDAGTINGYKVATIPLIRSQVVAFAFRPIDPRRVTFYAIAIAFLSIPSSRKSIRFFIRFEHTIRHSI
jgi:hypothetical protein